MHFETSSGRAFREHDRPIHGGCRAPRNRATALPESPILFRAGRQQRFGASITARCPEPMVGAADAAARVAEGYPKPKG